MSLHSLLTEDLEMPVMPIACTSSSTRRVEMPPIQASWITATKAFSTVRRGSRKPGKYDPWRSFGMEGLTRFLDDGRIEIDSNTVERSMRPIALNRKNCSVRRPRPRRRELGSARLVDRNLQVAQCE